MGTEKVDYATILADAEAKRAALEVYITSLKTAMAAGALGQPGEMPVSFATTGEPMDLPRGALLNKSIPAAIKLLLATTKKKQKSQQIATALKEGGMESMAANFETVVVGALHRLKAAGEVLRFKDGWDLAAHYPEHIRKAVSQEKKPTRKQPKKSAKLKGKKGSAAKASIVVPITEGLEHRIETVLKSNKDKQFSSEEIAMKLGTLVKTVSMSLGRMAAKHKAEKCDGGTYRAFSEKAQKTG